MRMSCNGCRVLRKGCSEDCSIRPCLQWIKSPEAQGNATVFLAKFYGRAGLLNLINAGPEHLRPAIFRSLLYEACGRVVNPIYGSVGLLWSGSWQLCQAAVDNVLKGAPIVQISTEAATATAKAFDIRHVPREEGGPSQELHGVAKAGRTRFKRRREEERAKSHESVTTAVAAAAVVADEEEEEEEEEENGSMVSEETAEGSMVTSHADSVVRLELTLGPTPATKRSPPTKKCGLVGEGEGDTCTTVDLALDLAR